MNNKVVKDENIKILLERRQEILDTINKLEKEYSALGDILLRVYHYESNKSKDEKDR